MNVYSNNKEINKEIKMVRLTNIIEKIKSTCFTFVHEVKVTMFWYSIKERVHEVPKVFG